MIDKNKITQFEWFKSSSKAEYDAWKTERLRNAEKFRNLPPIGINDLANPTRAEQTAILERCAKTNFALYEVKNSDNNPLKVAQDLRRFAAAFGLRIAETHRSAGEAGVVALEPSSEEGKKGYIPYTSHGMNWHTDGYYNDDGEWISAFVLHCLTPADKGGANQILDPEIAYIRLRDANPAYVQAFMHPAAMTIPENQERNGNVRPASTGPVFYPDPQTGRLQMRYTARTRSIEWRDDPLTHEAQEALRDLLMQNDPMAAEIKLASGQGILNNNVLHNRTAFETDDKEKPSRQILRVRFLNRIGSNAP